MNIQLVKAGLPHIEFLWYLRNQPDVYEYFRTPEPVSWENHVQWIMPRLLGSGNVDLFIIEADGFPAGQIRCDYDNADRAQLSISLLKKFRGQGIGKEALHQVAQRLKQEGRVDYLDAEINQKNVSSQKLFESQGFILERENQTYRYYQRSLRGLG